ncbi:YkoP family protein [Paenibacillus sp. NPDC058071]|uniref:YkoP family protein n=1 Tax=Paenibacillus sp. NPDC058071 TaxID=3346326 RepID=UPI0036DB7C5D
MEATLSKRAVQSLWMMWEGVFDWITTFRSASIKHYGICKLVVRRHHGRTLTCYDGHQIRSGDWVGELHLDNRKVMELTREFGADLAGLSTARMFRAAIKQIRLELNDNPEMGQIQAFMGITLLHRGIVHGIGFEHHPIKAKWQRLWYGWYLRLLLRVMHPEGKRRIRQNREQLSPMLMMISTPALKARGGLTR